jgi:hypothetical protein
MQGVLPNSANLRDWGLTLLALFLITSILVLNLPRITAFGGIVRSWQERMIVVIKGFITRIVTKLKVREDGEGEEGVELEDMVDEGSSDTGEV